MTELSEAASGYLAAGLSIIALAGKLPNTAIHKHGLKEALVGVPENAEDDALIERVFTHPETTGIAIVLHEHTVVVDIDGEDGARQFWEMVGPGWLGAGTAIAKTGRGLHLYYGTPRVQCTVKLGAQLDLKGYGGYVAAPPSQHFDAETGEPDYRYEWIEPLVDEESGQRIVLDWLPDPIERWLQVREQIIADKTPAPTVYMQWQMVTGDAKHVVIQNLPGEADIEVLARRVAAELPGSGNGNRLLHWAACAAAEDGHTLAEAYAVFVPVVTEEWASPMDARTARSTIRSAYKNTMRGK